ncbi:hypothetical protein [Streptococcus sp. HMSC034B05]|nr:hypothetical protein [Streptococcus sp. HMSC034B05]
MFQLKVVRGRIASTKSGLLRPRVGLLQLKVICFVRGSDYFN